MSLDKEKAKTHLKQIKKFDIHKNTEIIMIGKRKTGMSWNPGMSLINSLKITQFYLGVKDRYEFRNKEVRYAQNQV